MKPLVDFLFGIIFVISLGGLGVVTSKRLFKFDLDFFTGFFAGSGIVIVLLFICGLTGFFNHTFFAVFIILIFLFSLAGRRSLFEIRLPFSMMELIPLALVAIVLLMAAFSSLSPPIKNDTLYYHLGLPKLWAVDGGIKFYPWLSFSDTALNSELLLTPIVDFVSPEAAQFFVFLVGLMIILYLAYSANRHLGISPMITILTIVSVSFFTTGLFDAKNDLLAAGFALSSFIAYADYLKNHDNKLMVLAGVFAGLAAATKVNSLIFAGALFIAIAASRPGLKPLLLFAIPGMIFGSPWYIKAYIETGDPVYPFFNDIFHSPLWHVVFDKFNTATGVDSEHRTLFNLFTAPLRLVYLPDIFRARLGPLPLMLLPLLFFIKSIPVLVKKILIISVIFFVGWYFSWPNGRYLMPVVILLCLVGAFIFDWLIKNTRFGGIITVVGACLLIILSGTQVFRDGKLRMETALGIIDTDTFMRSAATLNPNQTGSAELVPAVPYYDIWQYLNSEAPHDAVVGILCSNWSRADGFYLDRPFIYLNPTDQTVVDFTFDRTGIIRAIVANNIRYVLIDKAVIAEFTDDSKFADAPGFKLLSRGVADFEDIIKQNGRLIYVTDRFGLYRLKNLSFISEEPFS
jgi:hypothetical protein